MKDFVIGTISSARSRSGGIAIRSKGCPRRRYNSGMFHKTAAALLFSACAFAAGVTAPSIDESLGMKSVAGAQISPDGRYVAYGVQQANWEENEFITQIWIAVTATGERYQLTSGKK